ncbi:MAG TPA: hypothetical protein VNK43_13420 [Gemmatimonadales bacterium]|nr:hypothetical protein [Gemmatimonadales bacterium]
MRRWPISCLVLFSLLGCGDREPKPEAFASPPPAQPAKLSLKQREAEQVYLAVVDSLRHRAGDQPLYFDPVTLDLRPPERRDRERDRVASLHPTWLVEAMLRTKAFAGLCHPAVNLRCDVPRESLVLSLAPLRQIPGTDTLVVQAGYGPLRPIADLRLGGRWSEHRYYLVRRGDRWVVVQVTPVAEIVA